MNKIAIVGPGGVGKDTVALILATLGGFSYSFRSSTSWSIVPWIRDEYPGLCDEQIHDLRKKDRGLWADRGDEICREFGLTVLIEVALRNSDIVVGIRRKNQLFEAKRLGMIDNIVWVHGGNRHSRKDPSLDFGADVADFLVANGGDYSTLLLRCKEIHPWLLI